MPFFSAHGYQCFAVSLRGHGESDVPKSSITMKEEIEDLASVISSLQRPPLLVAHSLGGIVAQRCVEVHDTFGIVPVPCGKRFTLSLPTCWWLGFE